MKLSSIYLKNFRSFGGESGGGTEIPLARINYLIGPNGAGKSNLLDGLEKVSTILGGGEYEPGPADYFNNDTDLAMQLGATIELSMEERLHLLIQLNMEPLAVEMDDLHNLPILRLLRYYVTFVNGKKQDERVLATIDDKSFHTLSLAYKKGGSSVSNTRNLKMIDLHNISLSKVYQNTQRGFPHTNDVIEQVDATLPEMIRAHFSGLRNLNIDRKIADSVPPRESAGLSTDGRTLPTELAGLNRDEQIKFDEYMKQITHGDPESVEPRMRGSAFVLETKETGLARRGTHADLGSGQEQSLILGWHLRNPPNSIFIVKEPELHLHPERQKQILRQIKQSDSDLQFVIETHSSVFMGAGRDERVILVTKDAGRSSATKIPPDNVGLIRRELGITYADAIRPANILFAEGLSDLAVFEPLLRAVAPEHAVSTMIYTLHGAHNTKNLKMLIRYLEADGRRVFVILDEDDEARSQVKELEDADLLDGNYHFLARSLEDEFDSSMVVRAAGEMAAEAGGSLSLTADELDGLREKGESVAAALKKRWNEGRCGVFSKVILAERIVELLGNDIPPGIEAALRAAVAHFGDGDGGSGLDTAHDDGRAGANPDASVGAAPASGPPAPPKKGMGGGDGARAASAPLRNSPAPDRRSAGAQPPRILAGYPAKAPPPPSEFCNTRAGRSCGLKTVLAWPPGLAAAPATNISPGAGCPAVTPEDPCPFCKGQLITKRLPSDKVKKVGGRVMGTGASVELRKSGGSYFTCNGCRMKFVDADRNMGAILRNLKVGANIAYRIIHFYGKELPPTKLLSDHRIAVVRKVNPAKSLLGMSIAKKELIVCFSYNGIMTYGSFIKDKGRYIFKELSEV